jgi:flagellin-like protein
LKKLVLRKRRSKESRRAASEVMGVIILLALTIAVGFAAWAWARSAASVSEKSFGSAINNDISCLNENFVITNVNFSSSNNQKVTVWFFNNGSANVNISITTISNSTWSYSSTSIVAVKTGTVVSSTYTVGTSFTVGKLYQFNAVARCQGDLVANYQQVR